MMWWLFMGLSIIKIMCSRFKLASLLKFHIAFYVGTFRSSGHHHCYIQLMTHLITFQTLRVYSMLYFSLLLHVITTCFSFCYMHYWLNSYIFQNTVLINKKLCFGKTASEEKTASVVQLMALIVQICGEITANTCIWLITNLLVRVSEDARQNSSHIEHVIHKR